MTVNFEITKITGGVCNEYPVPQPPPGSTYAISGPLGFYSGGNFGFSPGEDYLSVYSGSFSGIPVNLRENGKIYQGGFGGNFPDGVGIGTWERNDSGLSITLNGTCPGYIWGCGYPGTYQMDWFTGGSNVIPATVPCGNLG